MSVVVVGSMPQAVRSTTNVDLVLILALDVSNSVDEREFDLQRTGLVRAFRDATIVEAIGHGRYKRIAVAVVQWAGLEEQSVSVPWAIIGGADEAEDFAARLAAMQRRFRKGVTHISGVIEFGTRMALGAPFAAARRVIDISGDGKDNVEYAPHVARDAAVHLGMTINGLAIRNETKDLHAYYRISVIGGSHAFVIAANTYDDYATAILRKLRREISLQFAS